MRALVVVAGNGGLAAQDVERGGSGALVAAVNLVPEEAEELPH